MRILSGILRGKPISYKPCEGLRPTSDKVRQALFNMLKDALDGSSVLDLFGGTGALGIEALSCGASFVTFVEKNREQATKIKTNLEALDLAGQSEVLAVDASRAIGILSDAKKKYDRIFIDPPYEKGLGVEALKLLSDSPLLAEGAVVIYECRKDELTPEEVGKFIEYKNKIYGDTKIVIYKVH